MSLTRNAVNWAIGMAAGPRARAGVPESPESIFVLRNNDIGDLMVVTPMFEALKRRFPRTKLCLGVGSWSRPVLENNPWVDETIEVSAPWHNTKTTRHRSDSLAGWFDAFRYIFFSEEVKTLKRRHLDIGIDVLGSPQGALLLARSGVSYRVGVRGYAGGHRACDAWIDYSSEEHVGRGALRQAELLGAKDLPPNRPQLFLTAREKEWAESLWRQAGSGKDRPRVLIAPGGGFAEKRWPARKFALLAAEFHRADCSLGVVGGETEKETATEIAASVPGMADWTGRTSLRETLALVTQSELVVTNASMIMHAAAGLAKRTVVTLGPWFKSAVQERRQWGYEGDFLMVGEPSDCEARSVAEIAAMLELRHWLPTRSLAA